MLLLAVLVWPAGAVAQAPHVTALPTAMPTAAASPRPSPHGSFRPQSPSPHGSFRPQSPSPHASGHRPYGAPYQVRVNLNGADIQRILGSPSPKPTAKPTPHQDFPAPDVFSTLHTNN